MGWILCIGVAGEINYLREFQNCLPLPAHVGFSIGAAYLNKKLGWTGTYRSHQILNNITSCGSHVPLVLYSFATAMELLLFQIVWPSSWDQTSQFPGTVLSAVLTYQWQVMLKLVMFSWTIRGRLCHLVYSYYHDLKTVGCIAFCKGQVYMEARNKQANIKVQKFFFFGIKLSIIWL